MLINANASSDKGMNNVFNDNTVFLLTLEGKGYSQDGPEKCLHSILLQAAEITTKTAPKRAFPDAPADQSQALSMLR